MSKPTHARSVLICAALLTLGQPAAPAYEPVNPISQILVRREAVLQGTLTNPTEYLALGGELSPVQSKTVVIDVTNAALEPIYLSYNGNNGRVLIPRNSTIRYSFITNGGASIRVVGKSSGAVTARNVNPGFRRYTVVSSRGNNLSIRD